MDMFQSKDLSEEQTAALQKWTAEGDQLADLQKQAEGRIFVECHLYGHALCGFGFGAGDSESGGACEEEKVADEEAVVEDLSCRAASAAMGGVSVTVDQITTPGAMVSGRVTFSDGENGRWMIDQMGRPSLDPETAGYQPTHDDLVAFQNELRQGSRGTRWGARALEKKG